MSRRRLPALVALLALACAAAPALRAVQTVAQRYPQLASKLQCTCGCDTPMMQECETMQCSMKGYIDADIVAVETGPMRHEPMSLILQAFEQKYGSRILLAPPSSGFSLVVWIMPWVAAGLGLWLLLFCIRFWRRRGPALAGGTPAASPAASSPPPDAASAAAAREAALAAVREEMDRELRRGW